MPTIAANLVLPIRISRNARPDERRRIDPPPLIDAGDLERVYPDGEELEH
jgi:hypothetical protein